MGKKSLVHGVGINDSTSIVNNKGVWCPYYLSWKHMLQRCYDLKFQENSPTYADCTVCEEWLYFTKFRDWMKTQEWEGKHLDKDLLILGNKVYRPEACMFVEPRVNTFFLDVRAVKGEYPTGVTLRKDNGKFRARCCNPFTGKYEALGQYSTPEEAKAAWLYRKRELAIRLASEQKDKRIADAILNRLGDLND